MKVSLLFFLPTVSCFQQKLIRLAGKENIKFAASLTETPLIEKTFNTIDPLTDIYGPENIQNGFSLVHDFLNQFAKVFSTIPVEAPLVLLVLALSFYIIDFAINYSRSQVYIAELYSGIPQSVSDIVEIDAVDPKTLFYLPENITFTALNLQTFGPLAEQAMYAMTGKPLINKRKEKEMKTYESLINQAINQVNIATSSSPSSSPLRGVITGTSRYRPSEISTTSVDCIISINAFQRLTKRILRKFKDQTLTMQTKLLDDEHQLLFKEVYRMLKPGGLFCFYEAIDPQSEETTIEQSSTFLQKLLQIFPKSIKTYKKIPQSPSLIDDNDTSIRDTRTANSKGKKSRQRREQVQNREEEKESWKEIIKPGIVYQIRSTLPWRKFVIGVAIKPEGIYERGGKR